MIVTDHHRPGETLPDCPIVATRPSALPVPRPVRHGRRLHARPRAPRLRQPGARPHARPRRARDDRRRRAARRREPRARGRRAAGARADGPPGPPGADGVGAGRPRGRRRDGRRASGSRRGSTPPAGSAGPISRSSSCSRTTAARRRCWPRSSRSSTASGRASRSGSCARRSRASTRCPAAERRAAATSCWDEDWHEGVIGIVASRLVERFHRPVVLIARSGEGWKGSGRSISDFDLHGGLAACAEHLERFGGHRAAAGLSIDRQQLESFAEAFGAARRRRARRGRPAPADDGRRDRPGQRADARSRAGARPARAVRAREPRADAAGRERRGVGPSTVGEGKHLRFRVRQHGRDGGSAIAFGLGAQLDRLQRRPLRRRLPPEGEPLERDDRAAARRPARVRRARPPTTSCAPGSPSSGVPARSRGRPRRAHLRRARADAGGARRELLESASFRALLERGGADLPLAAGCLVVVPRHVVDGLKLSLSPPRVRLVQESRSQGGLDASSWKCGADGTSAPSVV